MTLLFRLQYLSESCFGNDNNFLVANPCVVLFFIYPAFYSLKILFTQILFGATPTHPPFDFDDLGCSVTLIIFKAALSNEIN